MKNMYPFSVDTWSEFSKRKPVHFLTHAHRDHTTGIDAHGSSPIYCSLITQKIVLRRHRKVFSPFILCTIEKNISTQHYVMREWKSGCVY